MASKNMRANQPNDRASENPSAVYVSIGRNRLQKGLGLERGLANAAGLIAEFVSRRRIVDFGRCGPAAGGVE
jgi:hypothetical protein